MVGASLRTLVFLCCLARDHRLGGAFAGPVRDVLLIRDSRVPLCFVVSVTEESSVILRTEPVMLRIPSGVGLVVLSQ